MDTINTSYNLQISSTIISKRNIVTSLKIKHSGEKYTNTKQIKIAVTKYAYISMDSLSKQTIH